MCSELHIETSNEICREMPTEICSEMPTEMFVKCSVQYGDEPHSWLTMYFLEFQHGTIEMTAMQSL